MPRRKTDTWLLMVLLAALTTGLLTIALLQGGTGAQERYDPRVSTMRTGISGAQAYFHLLEELGLQVDRHFEDPAALPADAPIALVLLSPFVGLRPAEIDTLLKRVERGDGLLIASGVGVSSMSAGGIAGGPGAIPLLDRLGFDTRFHFDSVPVRPAGLFEARGIGALSAAHATFEPTEDAPAFDPLIVSDSGPVALTFEHGAGRVVAFADPRYFTNRDLRRGDNALVAANAVAAFWSRGVLFDEYHQGFQAEGRLERSVVSFLVGHPLGWAALQLALAGLALLWLRGTRLGAPRPPTPPRRRSEMEHVEALATAYEKARAHRLAADRIRHGLVRRLGLRPGPDLDLWARLEALVGDDAAGEQVRRLRDLDRGELHAAELIEWGRRIHDLEEEVRRGWTSSARRRSPARR